MTNGLVQHIAMEESTSIQLVKAYTNILSYNTRFDDSCPKKHTLASSLQRQSVFVLLLAILLPPFIWIPATKFNFMEKLLIFYSLLFKNLLIFDEITLLHSDSGCKRVKFIITTNTAAVACTVNYLPSPNSADVSRS